jgi:DNA-directed RNA polymerase subunit RPC12/RpoP
MRLDFACPRCGEPLRAFHEQAGRPARCPRCDQRFTLPLGPGRPPGPYAGEDPAATFITPLDARRIRDLQEGQRDHEDHKAAREARLSREGQGSGLRAYLVFKLLLLAVPLALLFLLGTCGLVLGPVGHAPPSAHQSAPAKNAKTALPD